MLNKVDPKRGLSTEEIAKQKKLDPQNNCEENVAKSAKDIIFDNIMTLFNLLNFTIVACLLFVGVYSNLAFLATIIMNMSVGIFQEIHTRNLVQKLSTMTEEDVHAVRSGVRQEIDTKELVMEDIVIVSAGEQVPSDTKVIDGKVETNEALLTGKSDLIEKEIGDILLSGNSVVSRRAYAHAIHVNAENYAVKIIQEAKVHKPVQSELVGSICKVSKFTSWVIIPLGIILFIEAFWLRGTGIKTSVIASSAVLLGMLPRGLTLLISITLAAGVTRLAKKHVLIRGMYSIETLAHMDTSCLSKTGTITEGKMEVQETVILHDKYEELSPQIVENYPSESTDNNITIQAIRDHYEISSRFGAKEVLAFSSERKWGATEFPEIEIVYLRAPEHLVDDSQLSEAVFTVQEDGYRILMLAIAEQRPLNETKIPHLEPLTILEIDSPIRQDARETLVYPKEGGIDLRVTSSDNPATVSNIARRAGLPGCKSYIDLSTEATEAEVREAVQQYTVFGRVSSRQERTIVRELKDTEHMVAMIGDGVNDVLALQEAGCSIAMAEGDGATRQISSLVLLDSDFTTLPDVLFEGRRMVNNVTRVSNVFFIKTVYSFILSIIYALTAIAFPFIPIQVTLIDLAIEEYPTFFLSFEGDKRKVVRKFLPTTLKNTSVSALLVIANIIAVYLIGQNQGFSSLDATTLMYYLSVRISCMAAVRACLSLNPLRIFLVFSTIIGIYVAAVLFHNILETDFLISQTMGLFFIMMTINIVVRVAIGFVQMKRAGKTTKDL